MKKLLLISLFITAFLGVKAASQVTFSGGDKLKVEKTGIVAVCDKNICLVKTNDDETPTHFDLFDGNLNIVYSFDIPASIYGDDEYLGQLNIAGDYIYASSECPSGVFLTQYLFNDDDLYEFLIEDEEYKIYNEKGEFLGKLPEGFWGDVLVIQGNYFFPGEEDYYIVNKNESSVKSINQSSTSLAFSPNPVNYNDSITVTLPEGLEDESILYIYDLQGKLLYRNSQINGKKSISIPAYQLAEGVNPVTIMDKNCNIIATGKAIRK